MSVVARAFGVLPRVIEDEMDYVELAEQFVSIIADSESTINILP